MHTHYDQLTPREREFVDAVFSRSEGAFYLAGHFGIPLVGDDRIERAVDAFALVVIQSRARS